MEVESISEEHAYNNAKPMSSTSEEFKPSCQSISNSPHANQVKVATNQNTGNGDEDAVQASNEPPKKKKPKKKSKSKRGLAKPTGMEEFYADAPLTMNQLEDMRKLYNPNLPLLDRILTAIQRFERSRKLTPERRDIFYKWLQYGGIEAGQNIGTGNIDQAEMDKDEVATALSRVRISEDIQFSLKRTDLTECSKYVVAFEGCMKGFLSRRAQNIWPFDNNDQVCVVTSTLERFMDFLLQHDVCPEHATDILNTRNMCRDAGSELWACAEALRVLPGDFNIACSTLFGGDFGEKYDGNTYWGPESNKPEKVFVGFTAETASQIFGFAIAGVADEDVYQKYASLTQCNGEKNLEVIKIVRGHGFEITQIDKPTPECKDLYIQNSKEFRPVGRVYAKPWKNPEAPPEDLTDEEKAALALDPTIHDSKDEYLFFVEEIITRHLSPGMKIQATVRQLNCGVWFFDELIRVFPDFELYLVNEMIIGYTEPKRLPGAPGYIADEPQLKKETNSVEKINGTSNSRMEQDDTIIEGGYESEQTGEMNAQSYDDVDEAY